jgi:16S rRNA processing protein RimM
VGRNKVVFYAPHSNEVAAYIPIHTHRLIKMTGRLVHRYLSILSWTTLLLAVGSLGFLARRPFEASSAGRTKFLFQTHQNHRVMDLVLQSSKNGDLFAPQEDQQETRKKKKNKYSKFSKVETATQDPFEALVQESEQKQKSLDEAKAKLKEQAEPPPPSPAASKPLEYPNNKDIDPYDPSTFGYIKIGYIIGPHGVHGWAKVQGSTDFPERLTRAGMLLHIKSVRKRAPRRVTLAAGKYIGTDSFLVQLQGVYNRAEAQKLQGSTLYYATQQDIVMEEEDMLVSDLVGLQVFLEDDTLVGTVEGIVLAEEMCSIPGLGHDMLEVMIASKNGDDTNAATPVVGAPKD